MSIWIFVGAFFVIGAVGLGSFLLKGNPVVDTRLATKPQRLLSESTTLPAGDSTASAQSENEPATDGESASGKSGNGKSNNGKSGGDSAVVGKADRDGATSVTLPGGTKAPSGVRKVLSTDTSLSLTFDVPETSDGPSPNAVIAPTRVAPTADGNSVKVTVGCAGSPKETLAQLSVNETNQLVTVAAVVLVPMDATGCTDSSKSREFVLPLNRPLGKRSVIAIPVGTVLPELGLG